MIDAQERGWCWGGNLFGEVGNGVHGWTGSLDEIYEPKSYVPVPHELGLVGLRFITARRAQTCAVDRKGQLYAWGIGEGPQRRDHRFVDRPVARATSSPPRVVAPGARTCLLGTDGRLYCGGEKLGAEDDRARAEETYGYYDLVAVPQLPGELVDVATSVEATCVVAGDHSVWCWGGNDYGELGRPKGPTDPRPSRMPDVRATQISAGQYHFCVVSVDRRVQCWGQANHQQLGNPVASMDGIFLPVTVPLGEPDVVQVAADAATTVALRQDGSVWVWGANSSGLLGVLDEKAQTGTPTRISGLDRTIQIGVGDGHACALREDETVWCWGRGDDYQLGNGKNVDSHVPVQVVFPRIP